MLANKCTRSRKYRVDGGLNERTYLPLIKELMPLPLLGGTIESAAEEQEEGRGVPITAVEVGGWAPACRRTFITSRGLPIRIPAAPLV